MPPGSLIRFRTTRRNKIGWNTPPITLLPQPPQAFVPKPAMAMLHVNCQMTLINNALAAAWKIATHYLRPLPLDRMDWSAPPAIWYMSLTDWPLACRAGVMPQP